MVKSLAVSIYAQKINECLKNRLVRLIRSFPRHETQLSRDRYILGLNMTHASTHI